MKFFIDQNVPAAVDRFLGSKGYEVVLLRERIPTESPDALVAAVAEANNAILVTFDPDVAVSTGGNCHGIVNPVVDIQTWLSHSISVSNYGYYEDPKLAPHR